MRTINIIILFLILLVAAEAFSEDGKVIQINRDVQLKPLADNIWIHISFLDLPKWGRVAANGLVIVNGTRAMLIDTPWNDKQTRSLVTWVEKNFGLEVTTVIVCHYHEDNMGGLEWIHQAGIETFAIRKTQIICRERGLPVPQNTLNEFHRIDFSGIPIQVYYPGESHTVDAVCIYLPKQQALFGGCAVKALGNTTLGNIAEANLAEWPNSLMNIKRAYPDARVVVPGHGKEGDMGLIDHTLSLFE